MDMVRIKADKRQTTGKSAARQVRREGRLPAVIYGKGDSTALTIEADTLSEILHSAGGSNTILDMSLLGDQEEQCHAILREVQINPVTRDPLHVDFYRVDPNEPIRVSVVIDTVNELPEELQIANTSASLVLREVDIECLPGNIPESIHVDLAALTGGHALHAGRPGSASGSYPDHGCRHRRCHPANGPRSRRGCGRGRRRPGCAVR